MRNAATRRTSFDALEPRRLLSTYYVSTEGSDANAGTVEQPFASIRQAAFFTKPGDTVLVRGGTYRPTQQVWIGTSGTKARPIVYKPYKNEKVTIDGSSTPASTDLVSIGGDHVTLQGMTIANSRQIGVVVVEADGVTISGNRITGASWQGIAGWGSHANSYTGLVIEKNQIDNNTRGFFDEAKGNFAQGVVVQKCAKLIVRGNTVFNNWGEGILLSQNGDGSLVEDNRVHDNFGINIYLMDQNGATVQRNFCYTNGDRQFYRYDQPARAVQIANETWDAPRGAQRNTIVNNLSVGCSYGVYYGNYFVGGGVHDTTIANNTFVDSTSASFNFDAATHANVRVYNNVISQAAAKPYVLGAGQPGLSFASNLWYGGGTLPAAAQSKTDIQKNPRFVNAGTLDASGYQLQTKSPAINRGAGVSAKLDFLGTNRSKGKGVDLGAFEMK